MFFNTTEEYKDTDIYVKSLISVGLMQTAILYFSENGLMGIYNELNETIEEFKEDNNFMTDDSFRQIFDQLFDNTYEIKEKANSDLYDDGKGYK